VNDLTTLTEIIDAARATLAAPDWDFLAGGAGEESTLRANRTGFDRWQFRPRVMSGLPVPSTATSVLGIPLGLPVLTAPFGADRLFDADGHLAVARANAAHRVVSIVPEAGTYSWEQVAAAAPEAARIAQLHPMGPPDNFAHMLKRIEQAGYAALCITLDCPTGGWRERNLRNRHTLAASLISGNYPPGAGIAPEEVFGQLFTRDRPVWSWAQLNELMSATSLPWIAKGILDADDARHAVHAGASAVLVSNHGGRQLDGVPAAISRLPSVVTAVGGQVEVLLDSGVRRGSDVVKAVALGARAVVIGRLAAAGLAADGQRGVARVHELLRAEIVTILTLLGRGSITDLTPDALALAEP
jgi:4-hydroxymandelate oxidase